MTRERPDRDHLLQQQTVLASFGELALQCEDLNQILHEACRHVGRGLETDLAKVMALEPDGGSLVVAAGVGWSEGIVGRKTVNLESDLGAAYALKLGTPIISANTDQETRFEIEDFLREHGVKALVNVPIRRPSGGPPYGILEVDSHTPRQFTDDDISFLHTYANLLGTAVARLEVLAELRAAVVEKQRLFEELQHRVKNNLQVVTNLISLQRRRVRSDEARDELGSLERRVETLRLVHDMLHARGNAGRLDLGNYVAQLASGLMQFHGERVRLEIDTRHLEVEPGQAIPAGLIVNEFVTNSLKHAFDQSGGLIGIELIPLEPEKACLRLWDNGKGLPRLLARSERGSGMQLIEGLARQLGGDPQWDSSGGTRLTVVFSTTPTGAAPSS